MREGKVGREMCGLDALGGEEDFAAHLAEEEFYEGGRHGDDGGAMEN